MKEKMVIPIIYITTSLILLTIVTYCLAADTTPIDTIQNLVKGTYTIDTLSKPGMIGIVNTNKDKYMCIGKCETYTTSTTTTKPEPTTTTKPKGAIE